MKSKKLLSTIFIVLFLTLFSKLFGLARNALIASNFGLSIEADAYATASRITAQFFMTLGSAITATSIPIILHHLSKDDEKKAAYFVRNTMTTLIMITSVVTVLGIGFAPLLVKIFAFGFDQERTDMTIKLVKILFPILTMIPAIYLFVSVLQAHGKFSITSLISIPYNIIIISYLGFLAPKYGINGLAVATLFGWAAQGLLQIPFIRKRGFSIRPTLNLKDRDLQNLLRLIVPILLSSAVYNINMLIDNAIASTLTVGKLSALSYAFVVYTAISSTIIYGVSTVLFPNFAEFVIKDDTDGLKNALTTIIKGMLFLVIPMIFGVLALRLEITQIIYMRDEFTLKDAILTAGPLGFYMMGMIGFAFQDIFNRVFYAFKNTQLPLKTSIISVSINIVLNITLVKYFDLNGLAMATSIAVVANGFMLFYALNKKIGPFDIKGLLHTSLKILFSAMLMFLTVKGFISLGISSSLLISTGISVGLGILVYALSTLVLRVGSAVFIYETGIKLLKKVGQKNGN